MQDKIFKKEETFMDQYKKMQVGCVPIMNPKSLMQQCQNAPNLFLQ